MNKITKKKFRVKNNQDHLPGVLECILKGISQAIYFGKKACEFIIGLSVDLSKKESEKK